MFTVGRLISLAIWLLALVPATLWFLHSKAWKLFVFYVFVDVVLAGVFILSWTYSDLYFGVEIIRHIFLILNIIVIVVYVNDFKSFFFGMKTKKKSQAANENASETELQTCIEEIVKACQQMSKVRTGALIVIAPTRVPQQVLETGIAVGAVVSAPLLQSIFNTRAPMHDGAVLVKGNQLLAAGCFLPLSQAQTLSKEYGTRHRAAIGITEETDNVCVVVSEESGIISVAKKGNLRRFITPDRLSDMLYEIFEISAKERYTSN